MATGIMIAPNGGRLKYDEHESIPLTIEQTASVAKECEENGANAIHLHIRDENFDHLLDVNKYKQAIEAVKKQCSDEFLIQVTTETVGRYDSNDMRALIKELKPEASSVSIKELIPTDSTDDLKAAKEFYSFTRLENIGVQHILYSADDLKRFHSLLEQEVISGDKHSILFVLGRYAKNQRCESSDLIPYLQTLKELKLEDSVHWTMCAFGENEIPSLLAGAVFGGHSRIGFENSRLTPFGQKAKDNQSQVKFLKTQLEALNLQKAGFTQMREILGIFK